MTKLKRVSVKISKRKLVIDSLDNSEVFNDTLLLHACFQVVVDHVAKVGEDKLSPTIATVFRYWNYERPAMVEQENLAREWEDRLEAAKMREKRKGMDSDMLQDLVTYRQDLVAPDEY